MPVENNADSGNAKGGNKGESISELFAKIKAEKKKQKEESAAGEVSFSAGKSNEGKDASAPEKPQSNKKTTVEKIAYNVGFYAVKAAVAVFSAIKNLLPGNKGKSKAEDAESKPRANGPDVNDAGSKQKKKESIGQKIGKAVVKTIAFIAKKIVELVKKAVNAIAKLLGKKPPFEEKQEEKKKQKIENDLKKLFKLLRPTGKRNTIAPEVQQQQEQHQVQSMDKKIPPATLKSTELMDLDETRKKNIAATKEKLTLPKPGKDGLNNPDDLLGKIGPADIEFTAKLSEDRKSIELTPKPGQEGRAFVKTNKFPIKIPIGDNQTLNQAANDGSLKVNAAKNGAKASFSAGGGAPEKGESLSKTQDAPSKPSGKVLSLSNSGGIKN